jgi:hypothetical protein
MYMNHKYDIKHVIVSYLLLNLKNYLQFFIEIIGTKSVDKYKCRIILLLIMSQHSSVRKITCDRSDNEVPFVTGQEFSLCHVI